MFTLCYVFKTRWTSFWPICPEHVVVLSVFSCSLVICYRCNKSRLQILIFTLLVWMKIRILILQKRKLWPSIFQFQNSSLRSQGPDLLKTDLTTRVICKSIKLSSATKLKANISPCAFKKSHRTSINLLKTDTSELSSIRHKAVVTFISESCNCLNHKNLFPFLSFIQYNVLQL